MRVNTRRWRCQDQRGGVKPVFALFTCLCKRRKTKRLDAQSPTTKLFRDAQVPATPRRDYRELVNRSLHSSEFRT